MHGAIEEKQITGDISTTKLFNRGFTGHEHLDAFDVINMNGRLYDPVIARFPNPQTLMCKVQSNTQENFNRLFMLGK